MSDLQTPIGTGVPTAESIAQVYSEYAPASLTGSVYLWIKRDVDAALAAAREAEREANAKVAEDWWQRYRGIDHEAFDGFALGIAAAIRARGSDA